MTAHPLPQREVKPRIQGDIDGLTGLLGAEKYRVHVWNESRACLRDCCAVIARVKCNIFRRREHLCLFAPGLRHCQNCCYAVLASLREAESVV